MKTVQNNSRTYEFDNFNSLTFEVGEIETKITLTLKEVDYRDESYKTTRSITVKTSDFKEMMENLQIFIVRS